MGSRLKVVFLVCLASIAGVAPAEGSPCLVIGEPSARVSTPDGDRSPVFLAPACEAVQLISGRAQASWVGRDGKPRIAPITPTGPDASPEPGVAERSTYLVWSELTSKREAQRPAFMRALSIEREPRIFIPEDGLLLSGSADVLTEVQITAIRAAGEEPVSTYQVEAGQSLRLPASKLEADTVYRIQIRRGELAEQWRWRLLAQDDARRVQQNIREIKTSVSDPLQQGLLQAMLYEQQHLSINRALMMQELNK